MRRERSKSPSRRTTATTTKTTATNKSKLNGNSATTLAKSESASNNAQNNNNNNEIPIQQIDPEHRERISLNKRFLRNFNRLDPYLSWLHQPHTVLITLASLIATLWLAFSLDVDSVSHETRTKTGIIIAALGFLLFCTIQMPDGLFHRPHPMVWRFVTGVGVLYLSWLVFLLFQSSSEARNFMKYFDPSLGVKLPERSYAENCDRWETFVSTVFDEFIIAHFLGWFFKAALFRDYWVCWIMSILFEFLEITFQHVLPNFAECWWDHIILDVLVCNYFGFKLGLAVCHWLKMTPFDWMDFVEKYSWDVQSSWKKLISLIVLCASISMVELNAFFLKFLLWVPPTNYLNIVRLTIWWSIGLPAAREFYQYTSDPNCRKIGARCWLACITAFVELVLVLKLSRGSFPNVIEHPQHIIWAWVIAFCAFGIVSFYFYGVYQPRKRRQQQQQQQTSQQQT